ncbi:MULTISPECIES: hypothetical protein [unclassified Microcoleus]|uniref:hypothetical protein n=1 Tax=unclassified Microcoleus TaxID=2642155 RepID=UPI0025DDCE27|nr:MULTISPECIES: hypothetical protein [unclassified Microcoleus]
MNYQRLVCQVSLACFAVFCMEGLQPREVMAKLFRSLYAGQHDWVTWTLAPGSYVLKASTLLNLGDVDIEIYDTTDQRFAKGNKLGSETIFFNVPQGAEGDFKIKYSMPLCVNPAGACAVNIDIFSQ